MDAHAHLLSLGWAGPGHSLDSRPSLKHKGRRGLAYDPSHNNNNTGSGLVKPLLVSQKKNAFGIGKKAHEPAAGNEWWLKGFESALSKIGKRSDSEATSGTATPETGSTSGYRGKHNGLYGFFVRGQQMEGTMREQDREQSRGKKRQSDTFDDEEQLSTSSGKTTPGGSTSQENPKSKGEATADFAQISQFLDVRDKDRKRGERRVNGDPTDEFEQMGQFFGAGSKSVKKHGNRNVDVGPSTTLPVANEVAEVASKDEKGLIRRKWKSKNMSASSEVSEKEQRKQERRAARTAAKSSSSEKKNLLSSSVESTRS